MPGEPFLPVEEAPEYGSIVWTRFPEEVGKPGPKPRPALVLATGLNDKHKPPYATLQVAYGTSNLKLDRPISKTHLIIQNVVSLNQMRLPQATRFDLDHIIWLPWSSRFFEPRPGNLTPKIGELSQTYIQKLELLKAVRAAMKVRQSRKGE